MTKLDEFQSAIRLTGGYRTSDANRAAIRVGRVALSTLRYSAGLLKVFPMCALLEPFGRLTTRRWAELCFTSIQRAEQLGLNVIVEGFSERAAYDGPVVYLCNHMSTTETIMLPPILLSIGPFSYVAKASLAHLPFLERAAEHMRMVPISRKSPREDLMNILRVGGERIQGGDSFLIFPQGTRQKVFSRRVYSSIGAKLAERANCPIVPIVVDTRCQLTRESGMLKGVFRDFGPFDPAYDIRCCCGPVIPSGRSRVMHEAAFDWMASKLEEWGMMVER